uniref:Protein phosphatase 1 regulatory subunit 1B n=1 Tax=Geospiza parvula TaxID=87175 RepID=A0A8U8BAD1_GEOPR
MDPKERKKIQFSVPAPPSNLDPRAVEMVRGTGDRGQGSPPIPTPLPPQRSGEGCLLKPKRTNPCAYTPPSLKAVQRIVQSHLESGMGGGDSSDGEPDDGCDPDSALESGEGTRGPGDTGRGLWSPGGVGTGMAEPWGHGDGDSGGQGQDGGTGGTWGCPPPPRSAIPAVPGATTPLTRPFPSPERRHVGFAEVPSRPIGTERHSPTFPLGTS